MSTSKKNIESVNWQEVPDTELGWDEANSEDVGLAKFQEKYWCKWVWEAEEAKKCWEAEEAEKRACKAEEARQREVATEAERQKEAKRAKGVWLCYCIPSVIDSYLSSEAKKQQHTKSEVGSSGPCGQDSKCIYGGIHSQGWQVGIQGAGDLGASGRQMDAEVVEELQGLRKGSVDMLVNEVQIFGAEGYLPKLALESEAPENELQEALWEVEELQEEQLEWAMECLQMRKEWMQQEGATLTKCLKGKGKEWVEEKEQGEEDQETRGEEGEEVAE
ncbi:hypothetical protein ID866_9833 [Astraeus odoratus]|nr:hypothetical protein ID866_9833 [Astraeus odoratus]